MIIEKKRQGTFREDEEDDDEGNSECKILSHFFDNLS
jgi:hypothetical protein